jgi:diguanylate cyclase (GGDEF)-like protein
MLDLDHFKRVNDDHGHLVGDTVLAKVAEAVQGAIRGADSAVRYGGEEFCIILPGTRQREARTVAERVRQAIEAIDFSDTQGDLKVTGSLGVATLAGHEEIREWLQRADIALFTAKHDGRNRVEIAPVSITEDNAGGLRSKRLTMRQPTGVPPTPGED